MPTRGKNNIYIVDIYFFYHGFGLKAFEGRHIRMIDDSPKAIDYKASMNYFLNECQVCSN
jgi:hypothetical protein